MAGIPPVYVPGSEMDLVTSVKPETVTLSQREMWPTSPTPPPIMQLRPMVTLPEMPATITPLVYAIPVQLIAYHTAVMMGTDVDQPRNLAKSVTVE